MLTEAKTEVFNSYRAIASAHPQKVTKLMLYHLTLTKVTLPSFVGKSLTMFCFILGGIFENHSL
jgi:hypothetical protein